MTDSSRPCGGRAGGALRVLLACWMHLLAQVAHGAGPEGDPAGWRPSSTFVQLGSSEGSDSAAIGATWDWAWRGERRIGTLTGYWELVLGQWRDSPEEGRSWVSQVGITPVLRLYPAAWPAGWFVEAGIGVNIIAPKYRGDGEGFGTTFNFGDHLAVGVRFGAAGQHEVALRIQHFSNAGIKQPNPGENFVQLRYSRAL